MLILETNPFTSLLPNVHVLINSPLVMIWSCVEGVAAVSKIYSSPPRIMRRMKERFCGRHLFMICNKEKINIVGNGL